MRSTLLCCLLPLAVIAATDDPAKPTAISATFRALAFSGTIPDAAYAISEDERVPLDISSDVMTLEQSYRGPTTLTFTHLAKDLTEKPLASVQLADRSRVILLFIPDEKGGLSIKALRDAEGDFPWGTLRFINLTGARVRIKSGGTVLNLDNGGDRALRPAAAHRQYAMTEIETEREDGFARGYMLRTFQEDNLRAIYFLLPGDPREHSVSLKGVEERKGDERTAPPKIAPISLKPKDKSGKTAPAKPVNGQPKAAKR